MAIIPVFQNKHKRSTKEQIARRAKQPKKESFLDQYAIFSRHIESIKDAETLSTSIFKILADLLIIFLMSFSL